MAGLAPVDGGQEEVAGGVPAYEGAGVPGGGEGVAARADQRLTIGHDHRVAAHGLLDRPVDGGPQCDRALGGGRVVGL